MRRQWKIVNQRLGIDAHVYQLRHTGASADALAQRRTMQDIMSRGRWASVRSVKRYAKPGGIQR
eukprot:5898224-Karenia_brevis.AAC.1